MNMTRRLVISALLPTALWAQDRTRQKSRLMAEVTLQIVEASSSEGSANDAANLVPEELKALLRFTRYRLLDSAFVRGTEREMMRMALAGTLTGEVQFEVRPGPTETFLEIEVEIKGPANEGRGQAPLLETTTRVRSGETVVLGASRMRTANNALIVLLKATTLP